MSTEVLEVVENSINDLITALADKNPTPDAGVGSVIDRGAQQPTELSTYDKVDKLADIISLTFGLPIVSDEIKEEHHS